MKKKRIRRKSVTWGVNPNRYFGYCVFFRLRDYGSRHGKPSSSDDFEGLCFAVGVMMFAAKPIGDFVDTHPTLKILALAFLILVGVSLIAESLDIHIPKGYIYFAMGFSAVVEMLNIKMRKSLGH